MNFLILWCLAVLGVVCILSGLILGVIVSTSPSKKPKLEKIAIGLFVSGGIIAFPYLMILITQLEIVL